MKTSELTGSALDWAVAKANQAVGLVKSDPMLDCMHYFTPSTNWAQGGPIIERERISLRPDFWENGGCKAFIDRGGSAKNIIAPMHGPTPLTAAMRCYVASKLGNTVDIPEELTQ